MRGASDGGQGRAGVSRTLGRPLSDPCASIFFTTSRPSFTSPKTTWRPSSHGHATVVMKNCTPGGEGVVRRVFVNEVDACSHSQYLRAVGVGAGVGHAQQPRLGVLELEVLVVELAAVDGLPAGAVACKHTPRVGG